jgi:hypothetical protein
MVATAKKTAKKATKKRKGCNCAEVANEQLKPQGLELDDRMVMSFSDDSADGRIESPIVQLRWVESKRKKPTPPMFCAYCPFCGIKKA